MRRLYGAGPGHLLALLGCFAVSGYAATRLLDELPVLLRIGVWFLGAALAWDLVLGPLLALADRGLRAALLRGRVRRELVALQRRFSVPMIVITHDPADVEAMAETILVYSHGQVAQQVRTAELVHDARRPSAAIERVLGTAYLNGD